MTSLALFPQQAPTPTDPDDWRAKLADLARFDSGYQWYVGDLISWAHKQYAQDPDPALRALWTEAAQIMQREEATIAGWRQMAQLFPPHVRRPVSYRHHRAVFSLPQTIRFGLLDRAVEEGWSTREIEAAGADARRALAQMQRAANPTLVPDVSGRDVSDARQEFDATPEPDDVSADPAAATEPGQAEGSPAAATEPEPMTIHTIRFAVPAGVDAARIMHAAENDLRSLLARAGIEGQVL